MEESGTASAAARRPNPRDPYPEPQPRTGVDGTPATELGPDAVAILDGRTFLVSDAFGDVPAGSVGGLVHEDTRFVSRWELTVAGRTPSLLKSGAVDYDSAAFFVTNPELPNLEAGSLAVRRLRLVGDGLFEEIRVFNTRPDAIRFELRLGCGADFADLFEIRDVVRDRSPSIATTGSTGGRSLRFRYSVPGFLAETTIRVERSEVVESVTEHAVAPAPPRLEKSDLVWDVELSARCHLVALVKVAVRVNSAVFEPKHAAFGERLAPLAGPLGDWLGRIPKLESSSSLLVSTYRQSVVDLAALRITGDLLGEHYVLPAAGLPWFMTLFGRDTLITLSLIHI